MKPNKIAIEQMAYNKFLTQAFESVVSSTFISAIPMSDEEKGSAVKELRKYSNNALEAAGGYGLLIDAINTETNPHKKAFLMDINDICIATASEAAKRFALEATGDPESTSLADDVDALEEIDENADNEVDEANDPADAPEDDMEDVGEEDDIVEDKPEEPKKKVLLGKSLKELSLDARMTDAEYKSLARRAESIDIPQIAKIVSDKIIKTVNEEKKAYTELDEASERLKDALIEKEDNDIDTPEEAKEAVDRIIDMNFSKSCPREHKSLFSKIQLNAAETLMAMENVDFNRVDSNVLTKITCRTAPMIFEEKATLNSALEEVMCTNINPDCADEYECHRKIKFGHILSIFIITLLETLNTLSLHKMNRKEAVAITNGPDIKDTAPGAVANGVNAQSAVALENLKKVIRESKDTAAIEAAVEKLDNLHSKLTECTNAGYNINKNLTAAIESLKAEASVRCEKITRAFEAANESLSISEARKNDMGNLTDKNFMTNVKKNIVKRCPKKVVFKIANEGAVHVDFIGTPMEYTMSAAFESAHGGLSNTEYFKALAREANIPDIEYNDGTYPNIVIIDSFGRHTF